MTYKTPSGTNQHKNNAKNIFNENVKNNFHFGVVVSNEDNSDANRLKISIKGIDKSQTVSDLPYCYPLMPRFISFVPRVGETVLVFVPKESNKQENRFWLGPIIPQLTNIEGQTDSLLNLSGLDGSAIDLDVAPSRTPTAKGVYPNKEDVSLIGRKNTDIIHKDNELLLRSGKHKSEDNLIFNKDLGYIQIKNDKEENTSTTNIVSNKINILSHNGAGNFNLSNNEDLISDEELEKIQSSAKPTVFGDELIKFLELIRQYTTTHTHPYHGLSCVKTDLEKKIKEFKLSDIISKNVKIN